MTSSLTKPFHDDCVTKAMTELDDLQYPSSIGLGGTGATLGRCTSSCLSLRPSKCQRITSATGLVSCGLIQYRHSFVYSGSCVIVLYDSSKYCVR